MKLYTAPQAVPDFLDWHPEVFLAGSIEMGAARDWHKEVVSEISAMKVVVFNPRRDVWDPTWEQSITNPHFAEQVNWELDQIERADIVFFYFQSGTQSPITLMELGIVMGENRNNVIVVCEHGFWRRGNIEVLCQRTQTKLYHSIKAGIHELYDIIESCQPVL